jgi:hypothetical protein
MQRADVRTLIIPLSTLRVELLAAWLLDKKKEGSDPLNENTTQKLN